MDKLTARELMVLKCIAAGMSTKTIAHDLNITFKTAACHRYHILSKLDAANTADLICRAIRLGLIDVDGNTPRPPRTIQEHAQNALAESRLRRAKLSEALTRQRRLLQVQRAILADLGNTNVSPWKIRLRGPETVGLIGHGGGSTMIQ